MTARRSRSKHKPAADHPVEQDPAVERGERIRTGKTIARGGKTSGHVPGASEASARSGASSWRR
jgi:hypothetical protein